MSILINYVKKRDQGFTRRASMILAGLSSLADRAVFGVIFGIMVMLAAYATAQAIDDAVDARDLRVHQEHRQRADKAEALLLTALNGGAIVVDGVKAVFFDKAKEHAL